MKKTLLFAGMLLALSATVAAAAGLNLGWNAFCPAKNAGSLANMTDPCDGSTGLIYELVGAVVPPTAVAQCVAEDFFVDIQEGASQLSDYWHLEDANQPGYANLAGCRGADPGTGNVGSLNVQTNSGFYIGAYTGCNKTLMGTAPFGGVNYGVLIPDAYPGIVDPRRARLIGHFARSPGTALNANINYLSFHAAIDTNHQIDDPSNPPNYVCAGCQDGVCLVFNEIILYQPAGSPNMDISNQDTRQYVTWQGGVNTTCPGQTPTHKATWGQVKSLYR